MISMGFRAEKDTVHWAIVTGTSQCPILLEHSHFEIENSDSDSESLRWLRLKLIDLLESHHPDKVAVHLLSCQMESIPTPKALSFIFKRTRIEGVILETCCTPQINASQGRNGLTDDETIPAPAKDLFVDTNGQRIDWKQIKSFSRRQAILTAAKMLVMS